MLWSRAIKDMEGNIPWQRVTPTMLLWLHLLIVILIALAIARPVFDDGFSDGQRIYVVIDTSASMGAIPQGNASQIESGLEIAKKQASERVRRAFDSGRQPSVTVIESSFEPRVVLADSSARGRVLGAIDAVQQTDQPGDIHDAIELIETLIEDATIQDAQDVSLENESGASEDYRSSESEALVWLMSDGGSINASRISMRGGSGILVSPFVGEAGEPIDLNEQNALGIALGNIGIVGMGAQRDRVDPALCRLFVRLERNATGPIASIVRIYEGDDLITSAAVAMEEDEFMVSESFELRLLEGVLARVELSADDALASDNQAWVRIPDPDPVRITVVAPGGVADPGLTDPLEVISRMPVLVVDEMANVGNPDLVVYDRVSPKGWVNASSIGFASVFPDQDDSDQLEINLPRRRMISWDRSDPMVIDSDFGSVSYSRSVVLPDESAGENADEVDAEGGTAARTKVRVLARDRDGPVVVEALRGNHRHVRLCFALHDSNWVTQIGMPIFLLNAVEQLLPGTGGEGVVNTTSELIRITTNDGEQIHGPIPEIGLVQLDQQSVGLSLLDSGETQLAQRSSVRVGSQIQSGSSFDSLGSSARRELWRWFTLFAIVLISIEWFLYARGARIM
jgi:hypothetical protein